MLRAGVVVITKDGHLRTGEPLDDVLRELAGPAGIAGRRHAEIAQHIDLLLAFDDEDFFSGRYIFEQLWQPVRERDRALNLV